MKRICLLLIFGFISIVIFLSCSSSPQSIQVKTSSITTATRSIPVSSVGVIIDKKFDENRKGKEFTQTFFAKHIGLIKEGLKGKGIIIDDELFLKEFNSNPNIEFEEKEMAAGFVFHRYYWDSSTQFDTYINMVLNLVPLADGTVPLITVVKKDNPKYESERLTPVTLHLKIQPE